MSLFRADIWGMLWEELENFWNNSLELVTLSRQEQLPGRSHSQIRGFGAGQGSGSHWDMNELQVLMLLSSGKPLLGQAVLAQPACSISTPLVWDRREKITLQNTRPKPLWPYAVLNKLEEVLWNPSLAQLTEQPGPAWQHFLHFTILPISCCSDSGKTDICLWIHSSGRAC